MEDKELNIEQLNLVMGGATIQGVAEFASKNNMDEILNSKSVEELSRMKTELEGLSYGTQSVSDDHNSKSR